MTTINEKLKPCPFCGGIDLEVIHTGNPYYWVRCNECKAEKSPTGGWQKDTKLGHELAKCEAVTAWNTRATPDTLVNNSVEDILSEIEGLCSWGRTKGAIRFYRYIEKRVENLRKSISSITPDTPVNDELLAALKAMCEIYDTDGDHSELSGNAARERARQAIARAETAQKERPLEQASINQERLREAYLYGVKDAQDKADCYHYQLGRQQGLDEAIALARRYPASEHGYLPANPHDAALQSRDEIVNAIEALKERK